MLIEDDPNDRAHFERSFQACSGAALDVAADVDSALQAIDRGRSMPDVIFLDLRVPGCPPREFALWARQRSEFEKVLLIAVTSDFSLAANRPSDHGVHALLVKPVTSNDVAALMLLAQARRAGRSTD